MPPPKRQKQGRNWIEEFLSEKEKVVNRNLKDSHGNSPKESADGANCEIFVPPHSISNDTRLKPESERSLFHNIFYKSNIADEQRVPRSQCEHFPWQTLSLPAGCGQQEAFKKYHGHLRYHLEKRDENEKSVKFVSETSDSNINLCNKRFQSSSAPELVLSNKHGRLVGTFVASAFVSTAAQSIIYGSALTPASVQKYTAPNTVEYSNCTTNTDLDTDPQEFSQMSEENGSLLNKRLTENITNTNVNYPGQVSNICHEMARQQNKETSAERSKRYVESHHRISRLLSEHPGDVGQQIPVREADNLVHASPTLYSNGLYAHATLNSILKSQLYENQHRESLDTSIVKMDESNNLMSQRNYVPIVPQMSPSGPINQSPTSTTLDHVDAVNRLYPGLMVDGRQMKHGAAQGCNINKLCQVCSDTASGFHYGVWSCEGCKAFFKRSIQGPVDYVCPATNTCTIDKHRRKSCQACRLSKCYRVGMNKGSQRKERKATDTNQNRAPKRHGDLVDGMKYDVVGSPSLVKNSRKSRTSLVIEALMKADVNLPNLSSYHNCDVPATAMRENLLTTFVTFAERGLLYLVNFAKSIPGFTELVSGDQEHLLKCGWMDFYLLKYAIHSMEHEGRKLVFAADFVLEREYWSITGIGQVLERVADVSKQLVQYGLHNEELLLLQASVILHAEIRKLASDNQLNDIRQTVLDSFIDIAQKYHPDNLRHVPSVILLLAHIRQAAEWAIEYFQCVKTEVIPTFYDLLSEMLRVNSKENIEECEKIRHTITLVQAAGSQLHNHSIPDSLSAATQSLRA